MSILVTGGAGFIGSHLVDALCKENEDVVILDDFSTGKINNISHVKNRIKKARGSVLNVKLIKRAMRDVEIVFHNAAVVGVVRAYRDPLRTLEVNLKGTTNMLEIARMSDVERFIFASSSEVYGETSELPIKEDRPLSPISAYGVAKLAGEVYCNAYFKKYGLKTTILRYFNVYGPRQDVTAGSWVIPNFALRVLGNQPPVICGNGNQTRDFTHIKDAANGTLLAAKKRNAVGETFNLGTGREVKIRELAHLFIKIAGEKLTPIYSKPRPFEISRRCADITKAKKVLGYYPRIGLEEGIKKTLDYLKSQA